MDNLVIDSNNIQDTFQEGGDFDRTNKALDLAARAKIKEVGGNVFRVKTESRNSLYDIYLNSFYSEADKQSHTCSCCKDFLRRYGSLAYIDRDNITRSLLWDESVVDSVYKQSIANMRLYVESCPIETVFYRPQEGNNSVVIGNYKAGDFHHFVFNILNIRSSDNQDYPSETASCVLRNTFKIVNNNLNIINKEVVHAALIYFNGCEELTKHKYTILKLEKLYDLIGYLDLTNNPTIKQNKIWVQVVNDKLGYFKSIDKHIWEFLLSIAKGGDFGGATLTYLKANK